MNLFWSIIANRCLIWASIWLWSITTCIAQLRATSSAYIVSVKHVTTEQGLPNRSVVCFGQDPQGFVWLGTPTKAYRFDGKTFTAPTIPAGQRKVYTSGICGLGSDRVGNFWLQGGGIGNYRHINVIKPGQTQPQMAQLAFEQARWLQKDPIVELAVSGSPTFRYFRTQSGAVGYQARDGGLGLIFRHPDLDFGRAPGPRLFETKRHTVLVLLVPRLVDTPRTLVELDSTGRVLERHTLLPNYTLLPVWEEPDGTIYLHHLYDGVDVMANVVPNPRVALYTLSPDNRISPVSLGLPPNIRLSDTQITYDDLHDLFWVNGPNLLIAWHPKQGIVFDLAKSGFSVSKTQRLLRLFVDKTGAVWVGTANGFLVLTLEHNHFRRYLHVDDAEPTVSRQPIRAMTQLGNRLWVHAPTCQLVDLQTGKSQPAVSPKDVHPIYTLDLCPLAQTNDGALWAFLGGVLRYDLNITKASSYTLLTNNSTVSAWPDNKGKIWLGLQHGLLMFDTERKQPVPFTKYNQFRELAQQRITGFFPDRQQRARSWLWLTSSSGLYQFDLERGIIGRYSTKDKAPHQLPFDHIAFIHPDPEEAGVYWLATLGGGLIHWNRTNGTYQQFTTKEGLSDNTLYAIYEDKQQRLWLPSNNGLMSFHRKTHQIQIYHTKDGIADEEFNLMAHYRAPDGRLFLGGLNGITAFYPDQIRNDSHALAPLLVAGYQKLDTEIGQMVNYLPDYQVRKEIALASSDRLFKLWFGLLDYRYLGQTRLWYRIRNWQEKWVVHEGSELSFNGLPAGSYTLEVRAQNSNGDWASAIISVPIVVDKPVYLRWWFLLLCLVVGGGLIGLAFWWRNKQLIVDKQLLEAEVARRTARIENDKAIIERQAVDLQKSAVLKARFFANVTHEFKTPLTLLLGPLQYVAGQITNQNTRELLAIMERNAKQLLTLVNDLLDLSRLDSKEMKLHEQPTDIQQVVNQVVMGFMAQAHYTGIQLSVSDSEPICPMLVDIQKFETVLRNLIANALRYSSLGGYVQIRLSKTTESLQLTVEDNGSGIHPDDLPHIFTRYFQSNQPEKPLQGGTGIGLALCQEYCQLWGGSLTVDSQIGHGSTFTVTYPIRSFDEQIAPLQAQPTESLPSQGLIVETATEKAKQQPETDLRLMLVDDNADMLLYAKTMLEPYYSIQVTTNGRKALETLNRLGKSQLPDLIISDIMMPEVDGLAFVEELKVNPLLQHIPIILLTARTDLESRLHALRLGVADYLTKPFYEAELLTRIQNLLRRRDEKADWDREEAVDVIKDASDWQDEWIQWLQEMVHKNLDNEFFNARYLADIANLSERQLNRRIRSLTGLSSGQFIQEIRMQEAYDLFENQPDILVKNVALRVGYQKVSYFSQLYRERFGMNPEDHSKRVKKQSSVVE